MSAEYWQEWRTNFQPDERRITRSRRIVRFGYGDDDKRDQFVKILKSAGIPKKRIHLMEHNGLDALYLDSLNEKEFFGLMKKFWETAQAVEKSWQEQKVDSQNFDYWFYDMGCNIFTLRDSDFKCGISF